jgi:hypothetical protein
MQLTQGGHQIQLEALAPFLMVFETHMNILLIIKKSKLMVIKWSYRSPLPPPQETILTSESRMLAYFEHVV